MKKLEFKTSKGEFLLVERNEESFKGFPNGLYELFGNIEQFTEEQADDIVKFGHYCPHNYTYHKGYWDVETNIFKEHDTALNSLHSLLKSNGVVFENPLGNEPKKLVFLGSQIVTTIEWDRWQEAQSKVWNKSQTYLFKKI